MAPIRYSLHYEDYSEHLMSRFGKLLQMQSLVDMTLMCSSHTLRVHKAVLAASSAYFQEVLQKQTGEPLIILKMRFSVLKSLVEFMYCGKTQCLEENLDELVSAAQFLKIKGLCKVTKEGLGITNNGELPIFTPPVVINRPPQSLIDAHSTESADLKTSTPQAAPTSTTQPTDSLIRNNKNPVVRLPFDLETSVNSGGGGGSVVAPPVTDYMDAPRAIKPRRGRPSRAGWENGSLGRAAERALLRREHDSRKAINQLKSLQSRQMQDYMDRVTLSQAVNSICDPDSSSHNYMSMDNDFMYMDGSVGGNVLDAYGGDKEPSLGAEALVAPDAAAGVGSAMSEYVNALKSAGLPTDLPILFESGDGSYINVNEQVLLDMVQSSEIQYEVIEHPNIIDNVADPTQIKSIDDLSKSIEKGEMMIGSKNYSLNYDKNDSEYNRNDDTINSLNAILPDNLESFSDQQNYVVLEPRLQDNNVLNNLQGPQDDFSCIDGDMQFFTKLDDSRNMDLCPTSTSLDTHFSISLLDTKSTNLDAGSRQNDVNYDFELQLPQGPEDALDCLISTPKRTDDDNKHLDEVAQKKAEIIKDLLNIESNMISQNNDTSNMHRSNNELPEFGINSLHDTGAFIGDAHDDKQTSKNNGEDVTPSISSTGLDWDCIDINANKENEQANCMNISSEETNTAAGKDSESDEQTDPTRKEAHESALNTTFDQDIPFAVGLLPMKRVSVDEENALKRRSSNDNDDFGNIDAKCLKRKAKYKKL